MPGIRIGPYAVTIPANIPELNEIMQLARALHSRRQDYEDEVWAWPVRYEPENENFA